MSVLKINAGTVGSPDIRTIGCGGATGATGRLKLYADGRIWQEACDATGATASDDFNRTAASLGTTPVGGLTWNALVGTWETDGTYANSVTHGSGADLPISLAVVDGGFANGTVQATLTDTADDAAVAFRVTDGHNFFMVDEDAIYKVQAGSYTSLASWAGVLPAGSTVLVTLAGSSITAHLPSGYYPDITATSTFNQTATKHGIYGSNIGTRINDFALNPPEVRPIEIQLSSGVTAAVCMTPV